jgi:hypothetical protein
VSIAAALTWMGVLAGVGVAIDAAAGIWTRTALSDAGIFAFGPLQTGWKRWLHGRMSRSLSWLFRYPQVLVLFVVQLTGAGGLLAIPLLSGAWRPVVGACAAALVVAARMLMHARTQLGNDGSDQMTLVVLMSTLVGWLTIGTEIAVVAVCYAALQLMLSYVAAGVAKLGSRTWRDGSALPAILNTVGLGRPALSRFLRPRPRLSMTLSWGVIGFECLAPAWLLLGPSGAGALIVLGCGFHASIAYTMGLNTFFWAFTATYPALVVLAQTSPL